jgi:hypothetical protein
MNFSELQQIIKHLKKEVPCHACQKKFGNRGMQVISTFQNEALLQMDCFNCTNRLLVHVAIINQQQEKGTLKPQAEFTFHSEISKNEILDMHNFLNKFNGDFKELFTI